MNALFHIQLMTICAMMLFIWGKPGYALDNSVIEAEPENAWFEVTPEEYPHIFAAIAADISADNLDLLKFYIPVEEAPLLRSGEFENLHSNLAFTRGRESLKTQAESNVPVLGLAGKTARNYPPVMAWYAAAFAPGLGSGVVSLGSIRSDTGPSGEVLLYPAQAVNTWGFTPAMPVCQVVATVPDAGGVVQLRYSRVVNEPEDIDLAMNAFAGNALPADGPSFGRGARLERSTAASNGLLLHAALRWQEDGRLDDAAAIYRYIYTARSEEVLFQERRFEAAFLLSVVLLAQGKIEEAKGFIKQAENALAGQQSLGKAAPAVLSKAALKLKLSSVLLARAQGEPAQARALLSDNLAECVSVFGENDEQTLVWKTYLIFSMLDMNDYIAPYKFIPDVFAGATERYPLVKQAGIVFLMSPCLGIQGFRQEGAFYAKIFVGLESFSNQEASSNPDAPAPSGLDAQEIINSLHDGFGLETLDKQAVAALLAQPNAPGDTPYNKAAALMSGAELELYAEYGKLAAALSKAGQYGTDAEKTQARQAFQAWMEKVHAVMGSLP